MGGGVGPAAFTEEEWRLENLLWESDIICVNCGEDLHLTDEIFLLQVVLPGYNEQGLLDLFIVTEGDDYKYDPQFFHLECWEELWFGMEEHIEEFQSPPPTDDRNKVAKCHGCSAQIDVYETSGMLSFGELRCDQHLPDGQPIILFDSCNVRPHLICIECLHTFNSDLFEMWPTVSHGAVCSYGIHTRCWRQGTCQYECQEQLTAAE